MERRSSLRGNATYSIDYILERCQFIPFSGCWVYYDGRIGESGYGLVNSNNTRVHRLLYELLTGEDIANLQLHHICEVKSCCNPNHLEKLTISEHRIRHERSDASWCDRGNHLFVRRTNANGCATCFAAYRQRWREEKRRIGWPSGKRT
jgi:hypothetical protein